MITRFLDVVLDGAARTIARGAVEVHLSPKALDVLLLLVAERPRAVPKAELLERVWPGTFVTDASLARTIHEIRSVLADASGTMIRTVHGYGYAFTADAAAAPDRTTTEAERRASVPTEGWLLTGGRSIALKDGELCIGRDPAVDLPIESPLASWRHAKLVVHAGTVSVEDLASKNGTTVRGVRLTGVVVLEDGDPIVIAGHTLVFRRSEKHSETATADS